MFAAGTEPLRQWSEHIPLVHPDGWHSGSAGPQQQQVWRDPTRNLHVEEPERTLHVEQQVSLGY